MEEIEKWITPANTAVKIHLVAQDGTQQQSFSPAITESIYIHDDSLVGYKEPRIDIIFRSHNLEPSVKIAYKQKAPIELVANIKGGEALMDIEAPLRYYFAEDAFRSKHEDMQHSSETWTPPGEKLHAYRHENKNYEIWSAPLSDKAAIQILKNMKILVPMFIEGGTVNFLDDDNVPENQWTIERWRLFLLYEVKGLAYSLAGFSTSYHLPVLPVEKITNELPNGFTAVEETTATDVASAITEESVATMNGKHSSPTNPASQYPCRERISQFIILPPYQGSCHGIQLYNSVTAFFLANTLVFQITVEDPNENFDNLRDYCDLARLSADPEFVSIQLPESIPPKSLYSGAKVPISTLLSPTAITQLCRKHKLIPRQVQRLVELNLLRNIPASSRSVARILRKANTANVDDRRFYFWRLLVKHRVWLRNFEELAQVEEAERVGKIDSAADALLEQYLELIEGFERRLDAGLLVIGDAIGKSQHSHSGVSASRKRKVVDDDEDASDESDAIRPKRLATEELLAANAS